MDKGKNLVMKQIMLPIFEDVQEPTSEKIEISHAVSKGNNFKYKSDNQIINESINPIKETKIREDSNELLVITKVKKLTAYIITITEKSSKKFRLVFVNRMQNYCLDCVENLISANYTKMNTIKDKEKRLDYQDKALVQLKLLSYISFLSLENQCILRKQYEQISIQLSDCINLLVAWRRSDSNRNTY